MRAAMTCRLSGTRTRMVEEIDRPGPETICQMKKAQGVTVIIKWKCQLNDWANYVTRHWF